MSDDPLDGTTQQSKIQSFRGGRLSIELPGTGSTRGRKRPRPSGPRPASLACALALLTLTSTTATADGAGYAIELDGINGYLGCDLSGVIRGSNEITLSTWILRVGPRGELISPEPRGQAAVGLGFHFGLSAGKVFCAKGIGSGTYVVLMGSTAVPVSSWHHVAATFDGSTMRVYLDGVLDGSLDDGSIIQWDDLPPVFPPDQSNWPSPAQLFLGADKSNQLAQGPTIPDLEFFEGCMDEAQIWNRALSQGEIDSYRWRSLTGTELGLVGYWRFDEGTGLTTADVSAHGGDLTLYGGASWKVSTAPVNVVGVDPAIEASQKVGLAAFPNPTRGAATIVLESPSRESARVSVFDQSGRRVAHVWSGVAASRLLRWDGRDQQGREVASGVYLVRFETRNRRVTTRLLVVR